MELFKVKLGSNQRKQADKKIDWTGDMERERDEKTVDDTHKQKQTEN